MHYTGILYIFYSISGSSVSSQKIDITLQAYLLRHTVHSLLRTPGNIIPCYGRRPNGDICTEKVALLLPRLEEVLPYMGFSLNIQRNSLNRFR